MSEYALNEHGYDGDELVDPRPSSRSSGGSNKSRNFLKCVRCQNHGQRSELKGHKRYCPHRKCVCERCCLTVERQKMMAKKTAQRRREAEDARRLAAVREPPTSNNQNEADNHLVEILLPQSSAPTAMQTYAYINTALWTQQTQLQQTQSVDDSQLVSSSNQLYQRSQYSTDGE